MAFNNDVTERLCNLAFMTELSQVSFSSSMLMELVLHLVTILFRSSDIFALDIWVDVVLLIRLFSVLDDTF